MDSIEPVTCSCSTCLSPVGQFDNLWDKIGKTYYSPVYINPHDVRGFKVSGGVREAPKGAVIEHSFLQDIVCKSCETILGLRCDNAPDGHVLKSAFSQVSGSNLFSAIDNLHDRDQLILRLGSMVVSDKNNKKATLVVRNTYALKGPALASRNEPSQASWLASREIARSAEQSSIKGNSKLVTAPDDHLQSLPRFMDWAEDAIHGQRQDIDRISGIVEKIERDVRTFKESLAEFRDQFAVIPNAPRVEQIGRDVLLLQHDVGDMSREIRRRSGGGLPASESSTVFFVEEVEALTSSISTVRQKANEVDNLKLELQFVKGRLKRLEDAANHASRTAVTHSTSPDTTSRLSSLQVAKRNRILQQSYPADSDASPQLGRSGGPHTKRINDSGESDLDAAEVDEALSIERPRKRGKFSDKEESVGGYTGDRRAALLEAGDEDSINDSEIEGGHTRLKPHSNINSQLSRSRPEPTSTKLRLGGKEAFPTRRGAVPSNNSQADGKTWVAASSSMNLDGASSPDPNLETQSRVRRSAGSGTPEGSRLTKRSQPNNEATNSRNMKGDDDGISSSEEDELRAATEVLPSVERDHLDESHEVKVELQA